MLTASQQAIYYRFDAHALTLGLTRFDNGSEPSCRVYFVTTDNTVSVHCSGSMAQASAAPDPSITILIQLPTTGRYAKNEFKYFTIDQFEAITAQEMIDLADHVKAQTQLITDTEEQLKALRSGLVKYAKNALSK